MRKIFAVSLLCLVTEMISAQEGNGEALALKIAQRIADTLSLTPTQRNQLYTINMDIHSRKQAAWKTHREEDPALSIAIQKIENSRDSLYKNVMSADKFLLYRQKKRNLVNNN